MRLVHKETGEEVKIGDRVKSFRGGDMIVTGWQKPHSPASTGRINVKEYEEQQSLHAQSFYPSVYGCEWVEREDRE